MNTYRRILAGFVALLMLWHIYDEEKSILSTQPVLYLYGCIMPVYFFGLVTVVWLMDGAEWALNLALSICFDVFFVISIYYGLMAFAAKPLRKHFSAKSCGLLWLVPNYLYFLYRADISLGQKQPLLVLSLPGGFTTAALTVWASGFCIYFIYRTVSHLHFRRILLRDCRPEENSTALEIWAQEKQQLCLQDKPYRLIRSSNTATPLSIGLFQKSTLVVLPEKEYTQEELTLILRHELTHIYRGDCYTKLFLTVCTGMCWFNPLIWRAMDRCAEDLELSCDERVLENATQETCKQYAGLILTTAGDHRGFTTCLSATAGSLRYRLTSILHPSRKHWGGLLCAGVFLILAMSCGHISLAYREQTGAQVIFHDQSVAEFDIRSATLSHEQEYTTLECRDPEQLHRYLSGLRISRITGEYDFSEYEHQLFLMLNYGKSFYSVTLRDQYLTVVPYYTDRRQEMFYLVSDPVDWTYLQSLMDFGPSMILHILTEAGPQQASTVLQNLLKTENGETQTLLSRSGTTDIFHLLDETTEFLIPQFSHPVIDYTLTVENWNRTEKQTLQARDLREETFPILQRSGHYTVDAILEGGNGCVYHTRFAFDIHDVAYEEAKKQASESLDP